MVKQKKFEGDNKGWIEQEDGSFKNRSNGDVMTPHATRKHIFYSSQDGLMYRKKGSDFNWCT